MKRLLLIVGGVLLILVGIAGLILPILPGWVVIFFGLSLIAPKLAQRLRRRLFRNFFKNEVVHFDEWKKTPAQAGFTTRHFPLVFHKTDDLLDPQKQKEFSAKLPGHKRFVLLNQVHSDGIAVLEDASKYSAEGLHHIPESDAVLTNIPGLTLLVFTADCLPIFFSADGWIGLAHAGWRGTQSQIASKVLQLLSEKSGCKPKNIKIMFGPCIRVDHYEVGQEFRALFPASSFMEKNGKLFFDLAKENARQLREAGAVTRNIVDYDICTVDENDDFYSFRKEKDAAGRLVSFISLRSPGPAEKDS